MTFRVIGKVSDFYWNHGSVIIDRADYLKMPFERRVLPLIGGGEYGCCMGAW